MVLICQKASSRCGSDPAVGEGKKKKNRHHLLSQIIVVQVFELVLSNLLRVDNMLL